MLRIGISGWSYKGWRGVFYPKRLPYRKELTYASTHFNSIEINGTFYALQKPSTYEAWYAATPSDFQFSIKGNRHITHTRRLRDIKIPLANFFASGVLLLREKLGPFLWQLPPSLRFDEQNFSTFVRLLPRDTSQAVKLSRLHELQERGRVSTETDCDRILRHCIEVRHDSFMTSTFFELLKRCNIGFVIADTGGKWPYAENITTDFVYVRLHGPAELYSSGYTQSHLQEWASCIRKWQFSIFRDGLSHADTYPLLGKENDIYVYFDNDVKARAPHAATSLIKILSVNR